ncbi:MAG TPA: ATP-binding protein [Terriglobia bacterium]|nr:ATP-binding protein [Terriglobia bacterium]
MKTTSQSFLREYQAAMQAYLSNAGEPALERAYELGRRALDQGLGVLDFGAVYHRALRAVLRSRRTPVECVQTVKALESFFVESLSPYEMTHRGYRDAHAALRRLNELLEDETKKIAHALHDESGQFLVAVHIALEDLANGLPSRFQAPVQKVRAALNEMEEQLRRLSRELRPPILDDLGLLAALQILADGFSRRSGLKVVLAGLTDERLPPEIEIAFYRIVQEALTNVSKHARASSAVIRFERPTKALLNCSIRDDGAGFDAPRVLGARVKKGLGLIGIQERLKALDAALEIKSCPGSGTELLIQVPLGG